MASDGFWKLFTETGNIRLYLLYRAETSEELMAEIKVPNGAERDKKRQLPGDSPRG